MTDIPSKFPTPNGTKSSGSSPRCRSWHRTARARGGDLAGSARSHRVQYLAGAAGDAESARLRAADSLSPVTAQPGQPPRRASRVQRGAHCEVRRLDRGQSHPRHVHPPRRTGLGPGGAGAARSARGHAATAVALGAACLWTVSPREPRRRDVLQPVQPHPRPRGSAAHPRAGCGGGCVPRLARRAPRRGATPQAGDARSTMTFQPTTRR